MICSHLNLKTACVCSHNELYYVTLEEGRITIIPVQEIVVHGSTSINSSIRVQ